MRFRVIEVVSATIQLQPSKNVRKDNQISALLGGAAPSQSGARTGTAAGSSQGLTYSTGHKVGAGFLNTFFWGAGSFFMGDWVGGLIVGGMQVTSEILYIAGAVQVLNSSTTDSYGNYYTDEDKAATGSVMMVAGAVLGLGQIVVSFVRPFVYDTALSKKNGTYYALGGNPLEHINIAIVPDKKGPAAMNFTYSFSY
jgi:hypothetical protein